MEKRWIIFFLVTFLAIHFYIMTTNPPKKKQEGKGEITATDKQTAADDEQTSSPISSASTRTSTTDEAKSIIIPEDRLEKEIEVNDDNYKIVFTDRGGRPSKWELTNPLYLEELSDGKKYPVQIIPQDNKFQDRELPLEINFREYNAKNYSEFNQVFYEVEQNETKNGDKIITFTSPIIDEIQLVKRYTIPKGKYYIDLDIELTNNSDSKIKIDDDKKGVSISWGPGIGRFESIDKTEKPFVGAFFKIEGGMESAIPKIDKPIEDARKSLYGGLETKYFFTAIFPKNLAESEKRVFQSAKVSVRKKNIISKYEQQNYNNYPMTIELSEADTTIEPKGNIKYSYRIYAAPKNYTTLKKEEYPVSEIMFHNSYSWMKALCLILLNLLTWFQGFAHNYGIAIILLTIFIKIITHPLTHKGMKLQAKAMAEQQKIRPFMEEIQKKYKDNPQKRNAEMMKLYKEHGINPFGMLRGCIPILIQMPIFIAFYKILNQSIDLKNQSFLWIHDLSRPDALFHFSTAIPLIGSSFNLLPILMAVSQFFVSYISTTNIKDPTQRQMMIMMPIVFMFILYSFPSGLILYWFIQNLWQFIHQLITNKLIKKEEK